MVLLPGGGNWKLKLICMQCQKCLQCKYTKKKCSQLSDYHFNLMILMILCKFVC